MYPKVLDVAHTVKPTQKVEPYFPKLQEELNDIHLATGFEEILSKYKEIIGVENENSKD